jgi:histidinol-phosphate aminotransferase
MSTTTITTTGRPLDDLSMNETPYSPLPSVLRVIEDGLETLNRYPDRQSGAVVQAVAARLQVPAERVVVGPGSAAVCQLLVQALGPRRAEVVLPALSFEAYPSIIGNAGARPVPVPMAGNRPDLVAMAAAVTADTRCVLLCNPNNPTGAALRHDELARFLDALPTDLPVIIDEAYREFVTDPGVPDGVQLHRERGTVCVLRTFSKAYGLAGLRIGYGVAAAPVAAAARLAGTVLFPGSLGQAAAVASLDGDAEPELAARCAELAAARHALRAELLAAGLPVAPSEGNFLWLPLGEHAEDFALRCRQAGVLVRAYPGQGVRVTIGTAQANARLAATARESGAIVPTNRPRCGY